MLIHLFTLFSLLHTKITIWIEHRETSRIFDQAAAQKNSK